MKEKPVAFVRMVDEFDSVLVFVDFLHFENKINLMSNIALLNSSLFICWLSKRCPPSNELEAMGLEESKAPVSQLFDSVAFKVGKLSLDILLDFSVGCRLERGSLAALVDEPV